MHGRSTCDAGAMRVRAANLLGLAAVLALVSCQGVADAAFREGHAHVAADDSTQQGGRVQVRMLKTPSPGASHVGCFGLHVRSSHWVQRVQLCRGLAIVLC